MLPLILIILLVLLLIAAVPRWGYSRTWSYYPGSLIGVILVIVRIVWLAGAF